MGQIKKLELKKPKQRIAKKKAKKIQQPNTDDTIEISPRLATFTMVTVLKNQGLHHQALAVLDVLEKRGSDKDRIKKEKSELLKIMEN